MSTAHDQEHHGEHGPEVPRQADAFAAASNGKVGMWIFLSTDGLTFAGFLLGYALLRARSPDWPDPEQYLGIVLPFVATFILIVSSVTMVLAQAAGELKDRKKMLRFLGLTILGGLTFLGMQVYEYTHLLNNMGMTFVEFMDGPPQFASTFFLITGFHGFHVFSGVVYLMVIFGLAYKGKYDDGNMNQVEIAGLFWHFVDLVWILVFTFIYLIPRFGD